jgi:ABC-type multidrug transport system ATPase subunit
MEVGKGDIYGFLGPNGSGKSTTIRIMCSLVKADQGEIRMFDKTLSTSRREILSKTGVLIERPSFYEHLSARTNMRLLLNYSEKKVRESKIDETLSIVGLSGREDDRVRKYSEGMKQRLGIAQAIIHEPELLILDEPFNSLDPLGIKDLRDLIVRLNNEKNITVLISSHKLDELEKLVTGMVLIANGKAVAEGNVESFFAKRKNRIILSVDAPDSAYDLIRKSNFAAEDLTVKEHKLYFLSDLTDVPGIITTLVNNGISIFELKHDQSLESLFLSYTGMR